MAVNIDCLIRIKLSDFKPLIKEAISRGKPMQGSGKVGSGHIGAFSLDCSFFPDEMRLSITLTDEEGTQTAKQSIRVKAEKSNLIGSNVFYFVCNGFKCRTLYSDGRGFYSRKAFSHSYSSQRKGHRQRIASPKEVEPIRKGGKMYYKGKLTPYGKRVQKFNAYEERREGLFFEEIYKKFRI